MDAQTLLIVALLLVLAFNLWLCIRLWPQHRGLAIGCLLFWPLALLPLLRGQRAARAGIALPFVLTLLASLASVVLLWYAAQREPATPEIPEEVVIGMTELEMARIHRENPTLAAEMERIREQHRKASNAAARAQATPETEGFIPSDRVLAGRALPEAGQEAQQRRELEAAARLLSWRFGAIDLIPAPAQLDLPAGFRFVPRAQAVRVARLRGTPLDDRVIGWVVHQRVDMARDDAWYVQIRYRPVAQMPRPPMMIGDKDNDAAARADYAKDLAALVQGEAKRTIQAATWDSGPNLASWVWQREQTGASSYDYTVARPLPSGVLEFSVPALHQSQAELGQRGARLMATHTRPN